MTKRKNKKIDIIKLFAEEQTDFLDSLNGEIKAGMSADKMKINKFEEISTEYGTALRIELTDLDTEKEYSFLCSGKIFRKLFEANAKINDVIKIYLNEKTHWRFEFVE